MSSALLGVDLTRVDSTPIWQPGTILSDIKGGFGALAGNIAPTQPFPATGSPLGPSVQTIFTNTFSPDAEFKYVKAGSAISVGDAVRIDESQTDEPTVVIPTSAVSQFIEGIALLTVSGTVGISIPLNFYGWIQIRGRVAENHLTAPFFGCKFTAAGTAGSACGTSATAGKLVNITAAGPSNAEVIAAIAAATGRGIVQLDTAITDGTDLRAEAYIY